MDQITERSRSLKTMNLILLVLYVLVVYSTIPFAPYLVDFLKKVWGKHYGTFVSSSIALIVVLIALKFGRYLKTFRTIFWTTFLSLSCIIVLLTIEIPAERIHFLEYGIMSYLLMRTLEGKRQKKYILTFMTGLIIGILDELIQLFLQHQRIFNLPRRYFEWKDIGMNAFGVFLGCVFYRYVIEEGEANLREKIYRVHRDGPRRPS